jgi:GNAT superfamily N-acetyltransferase
MKYRLATPQDLDALANLRWSFIKEDGGNITISQSEFRDIFRNWSQQHPHCSHFIAENAGKVISMASLFIIDPLPRPIHSNPAWGYLTNVYTAPEFRNKGVASGLIQFVKEWIDAKQLETVIVWPNDESIAFYERARFKNHNAIMELSLR